MPNPPPVPFAGRIVMLGYGSVGEGLLPLLLRHLVIDPARIEVVAPFRRGDESAREAGVHCTSARLERGNLERTLAPRLAAGDLLLNVSVEVSSRALIAWCQAREVLYIDTCTEPWPGGYTDRSLPLAERTNYALREQVLALRREKGGGGPGAGMVADVGDAGDAGDAGDKAGAEGRSTALITLGANPGLVSFFVKQALLDLAGPGTARPRQREDWARLARRIGVRVIQVAERDDQTAPVRKRPGEFVNTWSVDGFIAEALQPAELGFGSHERELPPDGRRHEHGGRAAIYLERPGAATRVRTWTPLAGPLLGYLIPHAESISIAEYLTLGDPAHPDYRPTVYYAYHPCDDAVLSLHELAGRNWRAQGAKRLLRDDLTSGRDELGVLLLGEHGAYWYGSQLSVDQAHALVPRNSATTLQVNATLLAGVLWTLAHPREGLLEPDELPYDELLRLARPYLGDVLGIHGVWNPLADREWLYDERLVLSDPWQFVNFRVDG